MKYKYLALSVVFLLLTGCLQTNDQNISLDSNIQYLGIDNGLKQFIDVNTELDIIETKKIKLNEQEYKYILIDNNKVSNLKRNSVKKALSMGFEIFIIDVKNTHSISETLLGEDSYEIKESGGKDIVQVYTEKEKLRISHLGFDKDYTYKELLSRIQETKLSE